MKGPRVHTEYSLYVWKSAKGFKGWDYAYSSDSISDIIDYYGSKYNGASYRIYCTRSELIGESYHEDMMLVKTS